MKLISRRRTKELQCMMLFKEYTGIDVSEKDEKRLARGFANS